MNFSAEKSGERKQMNKLIYINNFVVIGFSLHWMENFYRTRWTTLVHIIDIQMRIASTLPSLHQKCVRRFYSKASFLVALHSIFHFDTGAAAAAVVVVLACMWAKCHATARCALNAQFIGGDWTECHSVVSLCMWKKWI